MIPKNVKALVFDLGGVIINLDPAKSFEALMDLSIDLSLSFEELVVQHGEHFWKHERGQIGDDEFRQGLRIILNNPLVTDSELNEAWNSMLLDIPSERINMLRRLKEKYRLIVLSNTNQIHVNSFTKYINDGLGIAGLEELFDKIYYSHQTGFRKPEADIFRKVINEQNLLPREVFFIDDNEDNIETAKSLGWNTQLLQANTLNPELY